jgi:hypothetical protein
VVATVSLCGRKRGVGVDTLSAFCVRLRLPHPLGCAPTALRGVRQALEKTMLETAHAWEQEGTTTGAVRDLMGAGDATCLEHMMLVFMDLPSGSVLVEAVAAARTYATWKAVVDERLKTLGTTGLSRVSARATALSQLADTGFEGVRMPDFFHGVHEMVQRSALAMGRRLRQAPQELTHAEALLTRRRPLSQGARTPQRASCWERHAALSHAMERGAAYGPAAPCTPLAHPPSLPHRGHHRANVPAGRPPVARGAGGP